MKNQKRKLIRRSHLITIVAAWVITLPAAAILSGLIFFYKNYSSLFQLFATENQENLSNEGSD